MALDAKTESASVSRRTIIKGAAWSAPVLIAAIAAPAHAASPPTLAASKTNWTNASGANVTFTLSPAPANGTYGLAVAGTGWGLSANRQTTSVDVSVVNGSFSHTVYPGSAGSTATLSVTGAKNTVSLSRTA